MVSWFGALQTPEEGTREELVKILTHILKESGIDGIGYRMLREYGTVDPLETTQEERINAAALSFISTAAILCEKIGGRFSNQFPIILLRMLAEADILFEALLQNGEQNTVQKLAEIQQQLERLYEELNQQTWQLSFSQQHEIRKLFQEIFEAASLKDVSKKAV